MSKFPRFNTTLIPFTFGPLGLFAGLFLVGCLQTGGSDSPIYSFIPDVEVECAVDAVPSCNSSGKIIYVGLTSDTDVDCESYLVVLSSTNFAFSFDGSGSATSSYDGLAIRGTVSSWRGSQGQIIGELEKRTYRICAYIDSNGDGNLDVNEPVGSGLLSPGSSTVQLTDWFAYFFL
ncbi:MAG: hypothetical protein H6624_04145 [Bdellovibrionaceae bacterium]|nr:hypothetical protein [Bdellovibrionales bacterium]MCB9083506.1 hypothetical protein [Pseudobdellovibrionaceae bacterium]